MTRTYPSAAAAIAAVIALITASAAGFGVRVASEAASFGSSIVVGEASRSVDARPAWAADPTSSSISPDFTVIQEAAAGSRIVLTGDAWVASAIGVVDRVELHPSERRVVRGTLLGGPSGDERIASSGFVIVTVGHAVAATVTGPGMAGFTVRGTPDGGFERVQHPAQWLGNCTVVPVEPRRDAAPAQHSGCDETGARIDVLVLVTSELAIDTGSVSAALALASVLVEYGNTAFLQSDLPTRFRIANLRLLPFGNDLISLAELIDPSDGKLDEVHALRDAFRADLTVLIHSGFGGLAPGLASLDPEAEAAAFAVAGVQDAPYVVAHELGHLLGCCHAIGDGGGCGTGLLFPWSNGHRFDLGVETYRTIMAYNPGAPLPVWSDPKLEIGDVTTGVEDVADNANTIDASHDFVAAHRCADEVCEMGVASGPWDDCNDNLIADWCEIARGLVQDANGNGIPDSCDCPGDVNGDLSVDITDLLLLMSLWGQCSVQSDACPGDLDGDLIVGMSDLVIVLGGMGECG